MGVWTFNERVYATRFLPETWSLERSEIIADRVARYLRSVRFERQSRPSKAIAEILKAAKVSKSLTVFLLSNGDTPMVGTPFDRSLNVLYREYRTELQRAGKPFVTLLTVNNGQFIAWDVSADLGEAKAPEGTHLAQPAAILPTNALPAQSTPPAATEQLEPVKATADKTPPLSVAPTATPPIETKTATTAAPQRDAPKPEPAAAKPEPEKVLPPPSVVASAESGKSNPSLLASKADRPELTAVVPPPAKTETQPSEPVAMSKPLSRPGEALATTPPPTRTPLSQPNPAKNEPRPALATNSPTGETPQQTAAVLPSEAATSPGRFAVWGVSLLAIALALLYWSARSHRQRRSPSLISRSMTQKGK